MAQQQGNVPARRPQTDVATAENTFAALVKRYEGNIRSALPEHVKPERMLSIIRTAITTNPGLQKCTPMSVIASIVKASRLGLECDGTLGEGYLVPRWNWKTDTTEAIFQIGAQGKVKLCMQSGEIAAMEPRVVYEKDEFTFEYTPELVFKHKPYLGDDKGEPVFFYLFSKLKSGHIQIEVMTKADVDKIRDQFGPHERCQKCWNKRGQRENCQACGGTGQGGLTGPWVEHYIEMGRKTVVHRGAKYLPKSVEYRDATSYEARIERGDSPELAVLDINAEDSSSAQIAGATDARKEDLKQKLAEKAGVTASKQDNPHVDAGGRQGETGKPAQAPGTTDEISTTANGGPTEGAQGETASAGTTVKSPAPSTKQIPTYTDLPDAFDMKEGAEAYYHGNLVRVIDSGWKIISPAPPEALPVEDEPSDVALTPPPANPPQTSAGRGRGRGNRNADAFEFNGGGRQ